MCTGMNLLFKNRKGLTLIEILISVLLMSIIFLGVSSLYLASRKLYVASSEKSIIGYEIQYAIQHIYKYAMSGIGDKNTPAFQITGATQLDVNLHDDPLTMANYSTVRNYRYRYDSNAKALMFREVGITSEESLIPKVTVTAVNFTKTTNILTGYITASYGSQNLTFYFSCYPRMGTFN